MRRSATLLLLALAAGPLAALGTPSPPGPLPTGSAASLGLRADRLDALGERVRNDVAQQRLPGAVLLIARKGQLAMFDAAGVLDPSAVAPVPMPHDAIFRLESMTKPLTVAAALVLVDRGQLQLDDPVARYLPEMGQVRVGVEPAAAGGEYTLHAPARPITVRDLMRHTAGLDYPMLALKSERVRRLNEVRRAYPRDFTLQDLTSWLARTPLAADPGTVWNYSSSIDVLGRLVEVVSRQSLGAFMKAALFEPLGMRDTAFFITDAPRQARLAQPFEPERAGLRDARLLRRAELGGEGLSGTAADYARFLQMLLNGGELEGRRVLSAASVAEMTRNQLSDAMVLGDGPRGRAYNPGPGYGYGLGVAVRTAGREGQPAGEPGDWWWGGGAGTYFWVDPVNQLVVVFMMQSIAQRLPYRSLLREKVYEAVER